MSPIWFFALVLSFLVVGDTAIWVRMPRLPLTERKPQVIAGISLGIAAICWLAVFLLRNAWKTFAVSQWQASFLFVAVPLLSAGLIVMLLRLMYEVLLTTKAVRARDHVSR